MIVRRSRDVTPTEAQKLLSAMLEKESTTKQFPSEVSLQLEAVSTSLEETNMDNVVIKHSSGSEN